MAIKSSQTLVSEALKKIKDKLKKLTKEAYDKDIFGAPTFIVNKKIFWGQDRLAYALDEFLR